MLSIRDTGLSLVDTVAYLPGEKDTQRTSFWTLNSIIRECRQSAQEVLPESAKKFWEELCYLTQQQWPRKHALPHPRCLATVDISCIFRAILMRT